MAIHLDIFQQQLNKAGEQLCGDTIRLGQTESRTIVVLSDGLGSGVKANILSTLTAGILLTMLSADAPLDETVRTVLGTLPVCKVRQLAYATFTVVRIDKATGEFEIVNFDNPRVVLLKNRQLQTPPRQMRDVLGRQIAVLSGRLDEGDYLALFSDGVLHAGLGRTMNLGWGWDNVARHIEDSARLSATSRDIVQRTMRNVYQLYGGQIGDDASMVGILARQRRVLSLFTGPPLDETQDERIVARFLALSGRHVVCGGTTGNIVARYLDEEPEVILQSMRPDIPPIAHLRELDLLTEGILTMSRTLELLRDAVAGQPLPEDPSGAVLLAGELLHADQIHIILGQRINEFYQNPGLPPNLSLRRSLVKDIVQLLQQTGRQVTIETC